MKTTAKKQLQITDEDRAEELKNVKIYDRIHHELKKHVVETKDNISEFVSQAIVEKLNKS